MFVEENQEENTIQDVAVKNKTNEEKGCEMKTEQEVVKSTKSHEDLVKIFNKMEKELNSRNLERKEEVRFTICSILCGEDVLFLGTPGTAKSKLANDIFDCFNGQTETFYTLITKYSVPEEIFGPMKISELKKDNFERQTDCYLPTSNFAFLDEVFKGNSSILNGLLSILNEKIYKNGMNKQECPLYTCIGASNELPQGDNLNALWDRFLTRFWVKPLGKRSFTKMLANSTTMAQKISPFIQLQDLEKAREDVINVKYSKNAEEIILKAKDALSEQGFVLSDRRWVKVTNLMRAHAWLDGRDEILQDDIVVVKHCAWSKPSEFKKVNGIIRKIENPIKDDIMTLLDNAQLTIDDIYKKKSEMSDDEFDRSATTEVVGANKKLKEIIKSLNKIREDVKSNKAILSYVDEAIESVTEKNTQMTTDLLNL